MRIELAHYQERSTTGHLINFAVFDAKLHNSSEAAHAALLSQLTIVAVQTLNLRVDAAGLAYVEEGQIRYWGDPFVLDYLKKRGGEARTTLEQGSKRY